MPHSSDRAVKERDSVWDSVKILTVSGGGGYTESSMGNMRAAKPFFTAICLAVLATHAEGATTWLWYFTTTGSTLDWNRFMASFGTWPVGNFTTENPWWDITTTTVPPTTSTIPTTTNEVTTPPKQPEIIESTDTIFLIIIIISCVIGLVISGVLLVVIYKTMSSKKTKKTKRLRVKPLKADQAFAPVIHPGMGMMDTMGMGGLMPPMDTGMMGMDPFAMPTGMDANAMGGNPAAMVGGENQWFG